MAEKPSEHQGFYVLAFAGDLRVVIVGIAAVKVFKTLLASVVFLLPGDGQLVASVVILGLLGLSLIWAARWVADRADAFWSGPGARWDAARFWARRCW